MVEGAAPLGRPQLTQEDHVGRAGEHGKAWAGEEGENIGRAAWQRIVGDLAPRETGARPY